MAEALDFVRTRTIEGGGYVATYVPVAPRPKLETEMVEAARKAILDALTAGATRTAYDGNKIELAKWVVLNFWTPDEP